MTPPGVSSDGLEVIDKGDYVDSNAIDSLDNRELIKLIVIKIIRFKINNARKICTHVAHTLKTPTKKMLSPGKGNHISKRVSKSSLKKDEL